VFINIFKKNKKTCYPIARAKNFKASTTRERFIIIRLIVCTGIEQSVIKELFMARKLLKN
jgi:hypothetical protein